MESLTTAQQELYDWLVEYIRANQHSPSIRQMMRAMNLRSPAPIQSRLEHLKNKGYIEWSEGKARTIRVRDNVRGVPILGTIAAGFVNEAFTDTVERLDLNGLPIQSGDYALKVTGDSMIEAMIQDGDVVIMRPVKDPQGIREGTIVAARVESGTTLKSFHREGNQVQLKPANPKYPIMEFPADLVDVQGRLVAVWRGIDPDFTV
ncbi:MULTISPECIES: transcriptional repressor LexA [unclassified Nodosilinea]|uniref:LexA repressor n=1 Tax=Leptolyngbya subtilissima DQ-A4 TaxID=2933933 RepID=A0ABV0K5W4_9CYAN|nr:MULTISPECIES: transcriptional repressor LexA [unclassified Nodosilinea]MBD2105389.1 repressor LexA [Nodosilinea sp. FACHB-13]MBD2113317.1 repressor LexA [Nodosilinea sp. FACHB-141]